MEECRNGLDPLTVRAMPNRGRTIDDRALRTEASFAVELPWPFPSPSPWP